MSMARREFLATAAVGATAALAGAKPPEAGPMPIVDTHQHLWDLSRFRLPWHDGASPILTRSYTPENYAEATRGLNVTRSVYMEVDVAADQKEAEVDYVANAAREAGSPIAGAVVGGAPDAQDFARYAAGLARRRPFVKGVRQVLHNPESPARRCLSDTFVANVQALGRAGLSFDLCMRPTELADARTLVERCPDVRFILDHCGNGDPRAFRPVRPNTPPAARPTHTADAWRRDITALAALPNLICKISGIVVRAPRGWDADALAPIVNHCLDAFGPDRVVFGGDWPVCLLGATYRQWVEALRAIVSNRPAEQQRKLWSENAIRHYSLGQ